MGCLHPGRASFIPEKSVRLDLAGSVGTVLATREYYLERRQPVVVEIEARGVRISFAAAAGDSSSSSSSSSSSEDDGDDDGYRDSGGESDSSVERSPGDLMRHLPRDRRPSQEDNEGLDLIYRGLDAELAGLSPVEGDTSPIRGCGGGSSSSSSSNSSPNRDEAADNDEALPAGLSMVEQTMREEFGPSWSKGHDSQAVSYRQQ
jgi:hypothetical protein